MPLRLPPPAFIRMFMQFSVRAAVAYFPITVNFEDREAFEEGQPYLIGEGRGGGRAGRAGRAGRGGQAGRAGRGGAQGAGRGLAGVFFPAACGRGKRAPELCAALTCSEAGAGAPPRPAGYEPHSVLPLALGVFLHHSRVVPPPLRSFVMGTSAVSWPAGPLPHAAALLAGPVADHSAQRSQHTGLEQSPLTQPQLQPQPACPPGRQLARSSGLYGRFSPRCSLLMHCGRSSGRPSCATCAGGWASAPCPGM